MKHLKLFLSISALAIFVNACSANRTVQTGNTNSANVAPTSAADTNTAPAPANDEFAAARASYKLTCVRCHKENGEGGAVTFDEGETLKVPSFKSGHGLKHTDAEFARRITKGGGGMPAFEKRLTPEQINGLVSFIRHEYQAGLINADATNSPAH